MRAIPDIAVDFIAQHEGLRLNAYTDSVGIWTIGYGSTGAVFEGMSITKAEAKARLKVDLEQAAHRLEARIGPVVNDLTEHQYAALLSFVFNLGAQPSWTIWKRLKAKQFDQVPGEMIKFVNAGGKKLQGLVNRRADEIKLWSTEEPGSTVQVVPSSVTRVEVTPPTPADPVPPAKSKTLIAGVIAAAGTIPAAAKSVIDTLAPWQESAPILVHAIQIAGIAGAAAAVTALVMSYLKKREARG